MSWVAATAGPPAPRSADVAHAAGGPCAPMPNAKAGGSPRRSRKSLGSQTRPRREELLRAARRREIDVIVVWRLDAGTSLSTHRHLENWTALRSASLVERGARSDDTQRAGVAGMLGSSRVRVRHSARPGESRHCSSPQGRSTSRQAATIAGKPRKYEDSRTRSSQNLFHNLR